MIAFSTKSRYATRILAYLACREGGPLAKKREIAEAEGLSEGYVEQILVALKAAGLVRSHRGKAGGFSLARDSADIDVAQVVEAMEGRLELSPCLSAGCSRQEQCRARPLWKEAGSAMRDVLRKTSIAEMAAANPAPRHYGGRSPKSAKLH